MPSLEQVRDQLESEAGVSPSIRWLDQCVHHIRGHNSNNDVISSSNNPSNNNNIIDQAEVESIWDQIRHSDLRNVIREPSSSSINSNAAAVNMDAVNTAAAAAAMQLRQAISQSKMKNSSNNSNAANNSNSSNNSSRNNKAVLPQNFQLMIQLEEVVDGSQNSEQRLASMGGNSLTTSSSNNSNQYNNNNNNRSEKWRSLKMVFSDGYYSNGRRTYSNNNDNNNDDDDDQENNVLYAMEISPITNLSTASVPGTKILLHGPITIRYGMLQLNDENAFVIGGQVPFWREIWTKAREKALREGGVGVDPTIKALIWNPLMGNEEEVDEGEGESGDVTAPRAPPPQQQQQQPPHGGGQSHTTLPVITPNHSMENRTQSHHQRGNNHVTNTTTTTRNHNINPTGVTNMNNAATSRRENFRQTTLDSYPKQNRTVTAAAAATTATTAAAVTSNPYQQRASYQNNSTNQQSSQQQQQQQQRQTANPYASTNQQQQQQPKTNPYASLRQNMTDQSNQDDAIDLTESPANVSAKMMDTLTSDTPQVAISSRNSTPNASNNNISSNKPLSGNLSFSEFKSLMQSLRHNRVLYEQYYGKEIVVLCKISSGSENKVFNIVKDGGGGGGDKKSKGKKEKVSFVA